MTQETDTARPLAAKRKDDHIRLALAQQEHIAQNGWDDVRFMHHALNAVDVATVDLRTQIGPMEWDFPLYINGMTGGTDKSKDLNIKLAEAAAETGIAIASGSLSVALDHPETIPTFRVLRERNPHGFVFANVGVGRSLAHAQQAVDILQADALQIHVNPVQEIVMPEGSREFSHWLGLIDEIVANLTVPVIVKEVGFGLSRRAISDLQSVGVQIIDVAGRGGTNFAQIESDRRDADSPFRDLNGWGQSAAECLIETPAGLTVLASGGIRGPLDAVRGLALGASGAGLAGRILRDAEAYDTEYLIAEIARFKARMVDIAALLGARTVADLHKTDVLLTGGLREFAELRDIDTKSFARRSGA